MTDSLVLSLLAIVLGAIYIKKTIEIIVEIKKYKKSTYAKTTRNSFFQMRWDKGKLGEYLIYDYLRHFEDNGGKFLFNTYIPKENGETTEIDVLLICSKGIFAFESKNYSGWIFGDEFQKNWTQTLPKGRGKCHKEHFYNPVMQNKYHIKHLKNIIGEEISVKSIIVFSERCTLKDITIKSEEIKVVKRNEVTNTVSAICNIISSDLLTETEISDIYNKLYPYTQLSDVQKMEHIANINNASVEHLAKHRTETNTAVEDKEKAQTAKTEEYQSIKESNIAEETGRNETESENALQAKCPRCGGNLVLRTARKGQNAGKSFYGCSNFPKCKYIQTK